MRSEIDHKTRRNIAVIGAGYWGVNHVRNFNELDALRMVCDSSRPALDRVANKFPGVRIESEFGRVLADPGVRAVVIATPAETHYELAVAAIEAGKDVLVEK